MHNDYFQKWCCLLIIDDASVAGINDNPDFSLELKDFILTSKCNCYIYTDRIKTDIGKTVSIADINENLIEYAFRAAFDAGYRKVILIDGSAAIQRKWLEEAFFSLKMIEYCIGPKEKGCYLFGMNYFDSDFFKTIPPVFLSDKKSLIRKIGETHLALYKTPLLADVPVVQA